MNVRNQAVLEIKGEMFLDEEHELWDAFGKDGTSGFESVLARLIEQRETEIYQRIQYEEMERYPFEEHA